VIRMKKYISLVIFLCLIVVSGVTYYKKMNLLSLPEEETVEYAEISYGISDEDPIYRITDEEKIAELFELVDMESWKKTNYVMEYSPLEYVFFEETPYRWEIGISENKDGTVCYQVSVYENNEPVFPGGHYFISADSDKYEDVIHTLKIIQPNEMTDEKAEADGQESLENTEAGSMRKIHTECITVIADPIKELPGATEYLQDNHIEITEEKTPINDGKILIYKERGEYNEELYPGVVYWIPQIDGMEDVQKQKRVNDLLKNVSQDWLYVDWYGLQTDLYLEYASDKYISYSYGGRANWGPHGWADISISITIDIENEKRMKLEDFIYLDDESFILNFAKYCFGSEKFVEGTREDLSAANRNIEEYRQEQMENNILSENGLIRLTSLEIYPTFFLRPNRLILNYYKWNSAEVTMELPVFIEYLKVEPWE